MEKYELIQEYPGSPKLNTIVISRQHPDYMSSLLWSDGNVSYYGLDTNHIINYPKFWKKIEDKDYEILSYVYGSNQVYTYLDTINGIRRYKDIFKNIIFENKLGGYAYKFNIYSIKRLSDCQVFTIGSVINTRFTSYELPEDKVRFKIESINLINNKIVFNLSLLNVSIEVYKSTVLLKNAFEI